MVIKLSNHIYMQHAVYALLSESLTPLFLEKKLPHVLDSTLGDVIL